MYYHVLHNSRKTVKEEEMVKERAKEELRLTKEKNEMKRVVLREQKRLYKLQKEQEVRKYQQNVLIVLIALQLSSLSNNSPALLLCGSVLQYLIV